MTQDDRDVRDTLAAIEDARERKHYAMKRVYCPRCGSEDVSDRQGHLRLEGNEEPPYLMICENCEAVWDEWF